MSRQTKFDLTFPQGGLSVKVGISKSSDAKTGLRQTYEDEAGDNRQVRTAKVLTIDDVKPQSLEDIEKVIPWNAVQSSFPYRDEEDGQERLLKLDDKAQCQLFKKSNRMNVVGILDQTAVTPNMYSGDHYFLTIQVDSKSKKAEKIDQQGYSLIFYILAECEKVVLVKFVSGDREKFGVIYRVGDGLMLSVLIHSNYQREAPEVERLPMPKVMAKAHSEKMLAMFALRRLDADTMMDKYEDSLKAYIEDLKVIAKGGKIKAKTKFKSKSPVSYDLDFFSQLDSL
jgi:non-homologous end joining protein Ku